MSRKPGKRPAKRRVRRASPAAPAGRAEELRAASRALLGREEEARAVRREKEDASMQAPLGDQPVE